MNANRKKNLIYSLVLLLFFVGMYWYRSLQSEQESNDRYKISINGEAQGSTYQIKYLHSQNLSFKPQIDSIFKAFDRALSLWVKDSEISRFNNGTQHKYESPYFYPVLKRSKEIYIESHGAFNPTVMPLVRAWGFGPDQASFPSKKTIDSLMQFINFDSLFFDTVSVCKLKKGIQLDFNAIAQGYTVDVIGEFLELQGIQNYLVEVGGEVRCRGKNEEGKTWSIGIANPLFEEDGVALSAGVRLDDRCLATSGNYRKFYEKDGHKYSHTIDPTTGYPVQHTLLSATVFAADGMSADAYATVFMVIGYDKTLEFIKNKPELDVLLIYADENGAMKTFLSEGIKDFVFSID